MASQQSVSDAKKGKYEFSQLSCELKKDTERKIKLFEDFRSDEPPKLPFWDLVVITASDSKQREAYETQLHFKYATNVLPHRIKTMAIDDPPGEKIGNGGSTLAVLEHLVKAYPDDLNRMRILVIHAGGFSQRLPSASLIGKVFTALPIESQRREKSPGHIQGGPIYEMLELKLALYADFPARMKAGGIFVTSADTFELFVSDDDWQFPDNGFTALAHPSPIEIGTTHGVFVLEENPNEEKLSSKIISTRCKRFLHKPTKDLMRASKAVFTKHGEDYVYSDSSFYIPYQTAMTLVNWYENEKPLTCEIDAYGDFLQALGEERTNDYCNNSLNVTMALPSLIKTRQEIFNLLKNETLHALRMDKSKFYHIGTTLEYLDLLCKDSVFRYEIGLGNVVYSTMGDNCNYDESSCMFCCTIDSNITIGSNVVMEYSNIAANSSIGERCIISNVSTVPNSTVPDGSFLYTAAIEDKGISLYITMAVGIADNLKRVTTDQATMSKLQLGGKDLLHCVQLLGLKAEMIWPNECPLVNLWHARIFPAFKDEETSFKYSCSILQAIEKDIPISEIEDLPTCSDKRYSFSDLLKLKKLTEVSAMRCRRQQQIEHQKQK